MSIRVVRLGSEREAHEGIRIGTARRPPRGVRKERLAADNWYDVWLPQLAPSAELVHEGLQAKSEKEWTSFARKYRREMSTPDNVHLLETLAALSHATNFSVGCYCAEEAHCHRSILRELLREHGASIATDGAR